MYLLIKDFENLAEFNLLQNLHLCNIKSVCTTNFGPFGKLALIFLYSFHREHSLLKLKKVIDENKCEKQKKVEFNYLCEVICFKQFGYKCLCSSEQQSS